MEVPDSSFDNFTYLFVEPTYIGRLPKKEIENRVYQVFDFRQDSFVDVTDSSLKKRFEVDSTKIIDNAELNNLMRRTFLFGGEEMVDR